MISWRKKQLRMLDIEHFHLDQVLLNFVKKNKVSTVMLQGTTDIEYFQSNLPGVLVTSKTDIFADSIFVTLATTSIHFETFLKKLANTVNISRPKYVYVAVNKYLVATNVSWPDLTDNYDNDLLNVISDKLKLSGYKELSRSYIDDDRGQYFNFAHPTTNAYYEII
jgi:hypothetical protein